MVNTYNTYKNSGIEWIPYIPQSWKTMRLKNVGFLYGGLTSKTGDDFNVEDDNESYMLFIPFTNIFNNSIINPNQLYKVKVSNDENQNLVQKNDLLFLMSSEDYDGIGKPAILEDSIDNLGLNSFSKGLRITNQDIYPKFLFYYLSSHVSRELVRREAKGFIRINLRQDRLHCCKIILPAIHEQQAIASFLDKKCVEIDSLITLQEEMIVELQAYKQSVITETVTKGLDSNAKMKDSGVEWIGEIPEGWDVKPFKYIFKTGKGLSFTKADLVNEGVPVISYGQVHSKQNKGTQIVDSLIRFVPVEMTLNSPLAKVHIGDFIFADTSEDLEGCGNCVYIDKEIGLYAGYHSVIAHAQSKSSNLYLAYLFLTNCWRSQIRSRVSGIKVLSISQSIINQTTVILPHLSEQRAITSYLDEKTAQIDALISLKQEKIAELKNYKKSIIYEYVTGKKRV